MTKSIATGATLTKETFDDFIERLKYHCKGEGVNWHHTRDPIFVVEEKYRVYGADADHSPDGYIYVDGGEKVAESDDELIEYLTEYKELTEEQIKNLHDLKSTCYQFDDAIRQISEEIYACHYKFVRRGISTHFTKEAAEAWIKRKQHSFEPLRIDVDHAQHCWEFNEIRNALLDGRLIYQEPKVSWLKRAYQYLSALIS